MTHALPPGDSLRAPAAYVSAPPASSQPAETPNAVPESRETPETIPETAAADPAPARRAERVRMTLRPQIGAAEDAGAPSGQAVAEALGSVYSLTRTLIAGGEAPAQPASTPPAPVAQSAPDTAARTDLLFAGADAVRAPGAQAPQTQTAARVAAASASPALPKTRPQPAVTPAEAPGSPAAAGSEPPRLEPMPAAPVESAGLQPLPAAKTPPAPVTAEAAPAAPETMAKAEAQTSAETGTETDPVARTGEAAPEPAGKTSGDEMMTAALETETAASPHPDEAAHAPEPSAPVSAAMIRGAPSVPIRPDSPAHAAADAHALPAILPAGLTQDAPGMGGEKPLAADLPPPPEPGLEPAAVYEGDFTGDGYKDRLVFWREAAGSAPFAARAPSIYASDGQGALQPRRFFASNDFLKHPAHVLVADFNGDGRDDIFIASGKPGGERLQLWLSGEDGLLHDAAQASLPDHEPWQRPRWQVWTAALGDIDADGNIDIMIGTQPLLVDFMEEKSVTRLFVNDGKGLFYDATDALPASLRDPALLKTAPERFAYFSLMDVNGDKADDLFVYLPSESQHVVFLNAGFGDFTRSDPLPARYFAGQDVPGKTGAIASLPVKEPY